MAYTRNRNSLEGDIQRIKRGFIYAILAAVLFGASTPAAKRLLQGFDGWLLAGLLYLGAGIGLLLVRSLQRIFGLPITESPLRGKDWTWLAAATFFGGLLAPVLLMAGLARTSSASASLLLNLETVFTAVVAWVVFREFFRKRMAIGLGGILAGSIVLTWTGVPRFSDFLGPIGVAGACLAWAVDNNLTRKISAADALLISMVKGLAAGTVNTVLALSLGRGQPFPGLAFLAVAGVVGFFGYGVSLLFFVLSLRHIGAARTGAYFALAPFIGAVIAVTFGAESLNLRLLIAGALLGAGVWLFSLEKSVKKGAHEYFQ